ncbi:MAG TPA: hypothetical protein VGP27_10045 [Mycobacterium sp.]|nr:hypothetical protein [Mycobacterium sp.]
MSLPSPVTAFRALAELEKRYPSLGCARDETATSPIGQSGIWEAPTDAAW